MLDGIDSDAPGAASSHGQPDGLFLTLLIHVYYDILLHRALDPNIPTDRHVYKCNCTVLPGS